MIGKRPDRPLIWPDMVFDLQNRVQEFPATIYLVGGSVRDALMHRPLHDFDLATDGDAIQLARLIANHFKGSFFVLDAERDVGRALIDGEDGRVMVDVAHFRGATLEADLLDRDFTVNAMAVDLKGDVELLLDPLGGEADLYAKLVRRCNPLALSNDPIRLMRAVRLSVQFGMRIETETLQDIRQHAMQLTGVSPERVRDEWVKLLSLPRPVSGLRIAERLALLDQSLPETRALHGFPQPPLIEDSWTHTLLVIEHLQDLLTTFSYKRTDNTVAAFSRGMMAIQLDRYRKHLVKHLDTRWPNERPHQALLMLAALLHDVGRATAAGDEAAAVAARSIALRLSVAECNRLVTMVVHHRAPLELADTNPLTVYHFWQRFGEAGVDLCLLAVADYLGTYSTQLSQPDWLEVVERIRVLLEAYYDKREQVVSPPPLVDGNQLMQQLALRPGPMIGAILEHIRQQQVIGVVVTQDDALQTARLFVEQHS